MKTLDECKLIARTSDPDWLGEELFRLQERGMTFELTAIREIVLEVLEDKLDRHALSTGGSFGFELDSGQKTALLMEIAEAVADRIAIKEP